jgi:transcriptional regulator with XRE-family HTH domain
MTTQNGRAFNEWLRAQLKAKKMSQRQLAQQSGVDHSTISRLIRGDRMPSLGTATKLARGLREIREDADAAQYLGLVANGTQNPTARVEYSLRADEALTEAQVRQIMEYYLAVRMRRYGRAYQPDREPTTTTTTPTTRTTTTASADSSGSTRLTGHALRPTSTVTSRPFGTVTSATGGSSSTGSISTIATVRPVSRSGGREPGRY